MGRYRVDPRKQFSKWLARWTAVFWFFYMTLMAVLAGYRPEAYMAVVLLASLTTAVMITSVLAYTDNSKYEKGLYAPNQIARAAKLNWKEAFGKDDDETEDVEDEEDGEDEEDEAEGGDADG